MMVGAAGRLAMMVGAAGRLAMMVGAKGAACDDGGGERGGLR
jgi:hypothetical protein